MYISYIENGENFPLPAVLVPLFSDRFRTRLESHGLCGSGFQFSVQAGLIIVQGTEGDQRYDCGSFRRCGGDREMLSRESKVIFWVDTPKTSYCWWKNPAPIDAGNEYSIICRIAYMLGGAAFLPSTAVKAEWRDTGG